MGGVSPGLGASPRRALGSRTQGHTVRQRPSAHALKPAWRTGIAVEARAAVAKLTSD